MINQNKREGAKRSFKDYLILSLYILGVLGLGFLALNQYLDFRYKAVWLSTPCDLCRELNPHLDTCFNEASSYWVNPLTGEETKEKPSSPVVKEINLSGLNLNP